MSYENKGRYRHQKEQDKAKRAYLNRGRVLWISCIIVEKIGRRIIKRMIDGTFVKDYPRSLKHPGKAAIKEAKRFSHIRGFYKQQREAMLNG